MKMKVIFDLKRTCYEDLTIWDKVDSKVLNAIQLCHSDNVFDRRREGRDY